jgi:hypothetical protein
MSFVFQVVLANGDIVKTASRARKSAAGFVLLSSSSSSFFFFFFLRSYIKKHMRKLVGQKCNP